MKEFKNASLKAVLLFLVFFLDGQVSQLITDLNGGGVFFTSHLLLLLLFFYSMNTQGLFLGPLSVVLGFFYDNYYLNGFGIAIFLVPLSLLVIIKLKNSFPDNFFSDLFYFSSLSPLLYVQQRCDIQALDNIKKQIPSGLVRLGISSSGVRNVAT